MTSSRGFTLVELMVSMAIMLIAISVASILLMEGSRMTRRGEEIADTNDGSRVAGDAIVAQARMAGMGAWGGLWVAIGSTPVKVSPIYGTVGVTGLAELWMMVPNRDAMRESCVDPGAATTVVAGGTGVLSVNCVANLKTQTLLVATNMLTGALLSPPYTWTDESRPTTPGQIDYAESGVGGYSNAPQKGGFQVGDMVYGATVVHFFIGPDSTGRPSLLRERGARNGGGSAGDPPFVAVAGTSTVVQSGVEDLQVAYGINDTGTETPDNIVFANTRAWTATTGLRSLRLSVVGKSVRTVLDAAGRVMLTADLAPMTVEGHTVAGGPDGHRRTLYSRRVELPNMAPGNL